MKRTVTSSIHIARSGAVDRPARTRCHGPHGNRVGGPARRTMHGKTAVDVRSVSTRATPNAVVAWNANVREASIAACSIGGAGPAEARMFALAHLAIHDALNGIHRHSHPYAANLHAPRWTSPDAAVAAAARGALVPTLGVVHHLHLA